jgi:hypothetical protein
MAHAQENAEKCRQESKLEKISSINSTRRALQNEYHIPILQQKIEFLEKMIFLAK